MSTINISLPAQLKIQAEELVDLGFYSSFSDVVRDALRLLVKKSKYDLMADQAMKDHKAGKGTVLSTPQEVEDHFNNL